MPQPIHLYRPQRTDPELLEKTFVAREPLLSEILERLERWQPGGSRQHYLFIGPRGIGKTNLLRLVEHRVRSRPELACKWLPVALPEDFYGVSSVSDLLLAALKRLIEETDDEGTAAVYEQARFDDDNARVNDRCLDAFRKYHRESGRGTLLMFENLDRLLERQIKRRQEVHLFRRILIEEDWLVAFCTSPTFLDAVTDPEEPFFEFFKVHPLAELTPKEQIAMLKRLAAAEKNEAFDEYLRRFYSRLRALYHFTGGNPRLTIMLYDLVANQNVGTVKSELDLLLDQLTPFYQDRMRDVSEQEAKVLEVISLLPEGCTPTELAQEARMPAKVARAVMSRLEHAGYLRREERRQKRTVYVVPERFFRIWHQMNHSRAMRGRIQYLLEFFSSWYASRGERDHVWGELKVEFAAGLDDGDDKRVEDLAEYMKYVVAISEGNEKFVRIFDHLRQLARAQGEEFVAKELVMLDHEYQGDGDYLLFKGTFLAEDLGWEETALEVFEQAAALKSEDVRPIFNHAVALDKMGRIRQAQERYRDAVALLALEDESGASVNAYAVLLRLLRDGTDSQMVRVVAYLIGRTADKSIVDEVVSILRQARDPWRRQHCATALGLVGDEAAGLVLLECLRDNAATLRGSAATALGRIADPRAVEPLIHTLQDRAAYVRGSAATALGRLADPTAVEPLILTLQDNDGKVRGSAATALGFIADPTAVEPLILTLQDDDGKVRGSTATALGRIADPTAVEPLIHALQDHAANVRGSAATALGHIAEPIAIEPLIHALQDHAAAVRGSAATALGRIVVHGLASDSRELVEAVMDKLTGLVPPHRSDVLRGLLRSVFRSADRDLIRRSLDLLKHGAEAPAAFWEPYEIAHAYLEDRQPAILERQQPEMREAVQLLVSLFDEAATAKRPETDLVTFFQSSPLVGEDLDLKRPSDP